MSLAWWVNKTGPSKTRPRPQPDSTPTGLPAHLSPTAGNFVLPSPCNGSGKVLVIAVKGIPSQKAIAPSKS